MQRMTSVRFPSCVSVVKTDEGFRQEDISWGDSWPAEVRDATNREAATAHQTGYDIERVFVVRCYGGQNLLKDDADGAIYDIKRSYSNSARNVLLECSRREPGRGYPEV